MAVEEGAAAGVLTGQAHREAVAHQCRVGHGLGETPVHRLLAGKHLAAVIDDLLHAAVQAEVFRHLGDRLAEAAQASLIDAGYDLHSPCVMLSARPSGADYYSSHT